MMDDACARTGFFFGGRRVFQRVVNSRPTAASGLDCKAHTCGAQGQGRRVRVISRGMWLHSAYTRNVHRRA